MRSRRWRIKKVLHAVYLRFERGRNPPSEPLAEQGFACLRRGGGLRFVGVPEGEAEHPHVRRVEQSLPFFQFAGVEPGRVVVRDGDQRRMEPLRTLHDQFAAAVGGQQSFQLHQ